MIIKGSTMSAKPLARAIWNELFRYYRKMKSDLNDLTHLLIDYDSIYYELDIKLNKDFYFVCYTNSHETDILDSLSGHMSGLKVAFLKNGDVEISEIDLTRSATDV